MCQDFRLQYTRAIIAQYAVIAPHGHSKFSADHVWSPRPKYLIQPNRAYESLNERRRKFFEELLEGRGFHHQQIALNVTVPGMPTPHTIDLVIYENEARERPIVAIDFAHSTGAISLRHELGLKELVHKARVLEAPYAAFIGVDERVYVDVELWNDDVLEQGIMSHFPEV